MIFKVLLKYFLTLIPFVLIVTIIVYSVKIFLCYKRAFWKRKYDKKLSVGFFHPYCNDGGGGERVLWAAVRAVQKEYKNAHCIIYSGDQIATKDIVKNVQVRFNIKLPREIEIVRVKRRNYVEAKYYPYFTLLFQSIGSVFLGFEALFKHVPDIYIDTMGYAFILPIFKLFGSCTVGIYVHFPTISTDMLRVVESRSASFNNRRFISNSRFFSYLKFIYYKLFAFVYGFVGSFSELIMVNSSWTKGHLVEIWKKPDKTFIVYPPCDVVALSRIPLDRHKNLKGMRIVSIAQFRPEKNHQLQIKAFHELLRRLGRVPNPPRLVLIGSCRHEEDYDRVNKLKNLCDELHISKHVDFRINLNFQDIIHEMTISSVALHSMLNEHFGIGVVECMAAGLIMVAHNSGGPKLDIVCNTDENRTGFLADDINIFADHLDKIYKMNHEDLHQIRKNARESVKKFSDENFENTFLSVTKILFVPKLHLLQ